MHNIILFIKRFFVLMLFLILQGISILLMVRYNKTYQAVFSTVSAEVGGQLFSRVNAVEYFLRLKETNRQLVEENTRLHNAMLSNIELPDTARMKKIDTLYTDSLHRGARIFTWLMAKVVNNSVSQENNYITLHRGYNQGIRKEMAVAGPDGIVGKVIEVSPNYCRVMSLLNRNSRVSVMLKKNNTGNIFIEWDGSEVDYLIVHNIPKSVPIRNGDTVLTSNLSHSFPPGLMVGTIADVEEAQASNYVTLKIKSSTNFYSLQYAYVIENSGLEEQIRLEEQTLKNQ